jgi:hypothetical protein
MIFGSMPAVCAGLILGDDCLRRTHAAKIG